MGNHGPVDDDVGESDCQLPLEAREADADCPNLWYGNEGISDPVFVDYHRRTNNGQLALKFNGALGSHIMKQSEEVAHDFFKGRDTFHRKRSVVRSDRRLRSSDLVPMPTAEITENNARFQERIQNSTFSSTSNT